MTIYTKQNLENEEKKTPPVLDVEVKVEPVPLVRKNPTLEASNARVGIIVRRERKRRLCLQLFLLLGILLGLSICLLGTLYLYRNNSSKSYSGWCGVKYTPRTASLTDSSTESVLGTTPGYSYLDEQVTVDGQLETLDVPQFDDHDKAVFIHDFAQEITLIQDDTDQACYILPLDTEKIPEPRDFIDLLNLLASGQIVPEAKEVQENYRLTLPPLEYREVLRLYGEVIASRCVDYTTYKLVKMTAEELSTTTTTPIPTTTSFMIPLLKHFAMFAGGDYVIQYNIVF